MSEFVRLGQHITIAKGKPPAQVPFGGPGATQYLSPEYLRGRVEAQLAKPGRDAVAVADGDAILLWDGSNAGEFFAGKAGLAASTMALIRADESFHRGYLVHALKHLEPRLKSQTSGTGIPHVDREVLEGFSVFRPAALEQARVAQILDTLDTTIRQTEAIIEKLKQVKQGLLHDLLTRGIDAHGELRPPQSQAPHLYKESPLGWIPKEWEARVLNDLVDQRRPIVYGILMPGQGHEGGVPVVKVKDIIGGSIQLDQLLLTSPAIDQEYKRSRLKPGDLLFTIRGSVGRTAFVPALLEGANITQDTARVGVSGVDARFVREYLAMPLPVRFIATHTLGVAVQGINLRDVRRIPIAVPSADEATAIADRLDATSNRMAAEAFYVQKLKLEKSGLMDDLLTGRVRVTSLRADTPSTN